MLESLNDQRSAVGGRFLRLWFAMWMLFAVCPTAPQAASSGSTERVSVASDGTQANDWSFGASISADGRYVAFASVASNLVPGDTNGYQDVFVRDRSTGKTERVSVAPDGSEADFSSYEPSISADGRYVAFASAASNLVAGDTNGFVDAFVRDRFTGVTERVSIASDGKQGNEGSWYPSISADGRYVAFVSYASNLVPGDTNGAYDVFVHDRVAGVTERVSLASDGTQADEASRNLKISADGRYVVFDSGATNLVPGDSNGTDDAFLHDRQTGVTERISVASGGTQGDDKSWCPSISADGRYVAFWSYATNLEPSSGQAGSDIYVRDRSTGNTERVSVASDGTPANSASCLPSISADGRYVAFLSFASNLAPGDTNGAYDVFVHDRVTGGTERTSVASDGTQTNGGCDDAAISADGHYVAFRSIASNLVPNDTNGGARCFRALPARSEGSCSQP